MLNFLSPLPFEDITYFTAKYDVLKTAPLVKKVPISIIGITPRTFPEHPKLPGHPGWEPLPYSNKKND